MKITFLLEPVVAYLFPQNMYPNTGPPFAAATGRCKNLHLGPPALTQNPLKSDDSKAPTPQRFHAKEILAPEPTLLATKLEHYHPNDLRSTSLTTAARQMRIELSAYL